MSKLSRLLFLTLFQLPTLLANDLKFPSQSYSIETRREHISSLSFLDGKVVFVGHGIPGLGEPTKNLYTQDFPFLKNARKFDRYLDNQPIILKKANLPVKMNPSHVTIVDGKILLLDSKKLEMTLFDEKMNLISDHSVVYDLITPAKDLKGAAPKFEVERLRKTFKQNLKPKNRFKRHRKRKTLTPQKDQEVILGTALAGRTKSDIQILLLTSIADFPVVLMECNRLNLSNCTIKSKCNIQTPKGSIPLGLKSQGLALTADKKYMIIGNQDDHSIMIFSFGSCSKITHVKDRYLPPAIKKITSLAINDKDDLFIGTLARDAYRNASIFIWERKDWFIKP